MILPSRFLTLTLLATLVACGEWGQLTDAEHLQRAKEQQDKGNIRGAVIEIKSALQQAPDNREARWMLGNIYLDLGRGQDAEKELTRARELGVNAKAMNVLLARAWLLQGEFDKVLEIQTASAAAEEQAGLLTARGEALLSLRRTPEGCDALRQAQQADSKYLLVYHGLARCALAQQDKKATREYITQAIALNNNYPDNFVLLGDFERLEKNLPAAEEAYNRAVTLRPQHVPALLGRAAARLEADRPAAAEPDIAKILSLVPNYPPALQLKGMLLFKKKNYADAKTTFEAVLKAQPGYLSAILWLGMSDYALNNVEQAAYRFGQFLTVMPQASEIRTLQAYLLARMGKKEEADALLKPVQATRLDDPQSLSLVGQTYVMLGNFESGVRELQRAVASDPKSIEYRAHLAQALIEKGDMAAALEQLEQAAALAPENIQAATALVKGYIAARDFPRALAELDKMDAAHPQDPLPRNFRGVVWLIQKDHARASAAFQAALALKPGFPLAAHNLAQMALARGARDEARGYYTQTLKAHPDHLPTLMALYRLDLQGGERAAARRWLEQAAEARPDDVDPATLLARDYLADNNPDKALNIIQQAIRAHPNDTGLLEARGAAYLAAGEAASAATTYRRLTELRADSAHAFYLLATAEAALQDTAKTRQALQESLKRDAAYLPAKAALARLALNGREWETALRLSKELQAQHAQVAEGQVLEAEVYLGQQQAARAVALLKRTREKFPASGPVTLALARAYWQGGEQQNAIALVQAWQSSHPQDVAAQAFLGDSYSALRRFDEASAQYLKILRVDPKNVYALNNLAFAYTKTNPAQAVTYGSQAYALAPNSTAVADTYGWALLANGQTDKALALLEPIGSANNAPPSYRYHYAAALARAQQLAPARQILQELSTVVFAEQAEARALLANLAAPK